LIFDDISIWIFEQIDEKKMHVLSFDSLLIILTDYLQIFFDSVLEMYCIISDEFGYAVFVEKKIVLTWVFFVGFLDLLIFIGLFQIIFFNCV